jgi:hypothetical protein
MARTGRPPVPAEIKRRRGTARPDRTPNELDVVALPMADGVPVPPDELGPEGMAMWRSVWEAGRHWVSPTEMPFELLWLCQAADERVQLRKLVMLGADEKYRKALRDVEKHMTQWVQDLGFSPVARSRMGLAEVKAQTALEGLRAKRTS